MTQQHLKNLTEQLFNNELMQYWPLINEIINRSLIQRVNTNDSKDYLKSVITSFVTNQTLKYRFSYEDFTSKSQYYEFIEILIPEFSSNIDKLQNDIHQSKSMIIFDFSSENDSVVIFLSTIAAAKQYGNE